MTFIAFVFLFGGAINAHNTGGLKDFDELVKDTKAAIENAAPLEADRLGNYGND